MNAQEQEQQNIAQTVEKLTKLHPNVAPADVRRAVDRAHKRFEGEPIRDFVPLLVERRAQEELGGNPTAVPTSLDEPEV